MTNTTLHSSPHLHGSGALGTVSNLMMQVLLAAVPGIVALVYFFGWGVIVNIALASLAALIFESAVLMARKRPVISTLRDCSALVTAMLLAIALPPYCPWWIVIGGSAFAILIAKHVYGGLGYNPFNPAMAAYVFLLISFPVEMTTWAKPLGTSPEYTPPGLMDAWRYIFGTEHDGMTAATPLDLWHTHDELSLVQLQAHRPVFGRWGGLGWEYVNLGFLLGGVYLLYRRVYTWHAPLGFLGAFALLVMLANPTDPFNMLAFHCFNGAMMLGAFFIVTDPVSSAVSNRARLLCGIGAGCLLFTMRFWSNYPDAVAFAVLLMNFSAPLIDHYIQPRTYGHR